MLSITPINSICTKPAQETTGSVALRRRTMNETAGSVAMRSSGTSSETIGTVGLSGSGSSETTGSIAFRGKTINETTGSVAFKGKGANLLKEAAKKIKCNPVGKKISTKEAKGMFEKFSKETIKRLKIEQAFKRSSAEGIEVLIRETLGDILKLFKK